MKNFKKYLVLALCFGLSLSSINAAEKVAHLSQFIKMGKEATNPAERNSALQEALRLVDGVYQYYADNGQPVSFGKIAQKFQDAFDMSIEEAKAQELGQGRDQLMAERDKALEGIRQSREQRKETGKKIRTKITTERKKNQRLQATMEELQAAQEEIRGLRRALENGGNNNDVAQLLQEQDDRNRRVADIATQNILLMREDLQQEQDARTAAEEALENARRETANKDDEISDLQEQIEALQGQINRLQKGSTTTGSSIQNDCEKRLELLQSTNRNNALLIGELNREVAELKKANAALEAMLNDEEE